MELVDSHCHLDDEQFANDRDGVIARAREAGLKHLLAIGTGNGPPDLEAALRLANNYAFVYATAGVHPNDAAKVQAGTLNHLAELCRHPKIVAIGEIGLDYYWQTPPELQAPLFREQLALAAQMELPVIIHTRDAWADTLSILREDWAHTGLGCVMHCFTGSPTQAQACLDLGFTLAFGGVTTFPKAEGVREAASIVPEDKLLLETDSPYLAPVPFRGKRNEPAHVAHVAETLARVRNTSVDRIASVSTDNFERLFLAGRTGHQRLH